VPIVRINAGARSFALVRWGLIPAWVKDPRGFALLINARGETVNEKPAFRNAMQRRRCLVPANGFYEWKPDGAGKRPYFIRPRGGGPIAFAGLWETWMGPNGEEVETACIVTTTANSTLAPIHDRMPVVIAPEAFDLWLDTANVDATTAAALMAPAPDNCSRATRFRPPSTVRRTIPGPDRAGRLLAAAAVPIAPERPAARKAKPKRMMGRHRCFEIPTSSEERVPEHLSKDAHFSG